MLLAAGAVAVPADANEGDGGVWVRGSGDWSGPHPADSTQPPSHDVPGGPANATWLLLDGELASYLIQSDGGGQITCSDGSGTLVSADGEGQNGRCGAGESSENQSLLWFETPQERWSGTFQIESTTPALAAAAQPSTTPGTILAVVAAVAIIASAALAILFVRERRLTSLLARRLWEKSRSGKTRKEGEPLQEDRVRRIIVRSKN